MAKSRTRLHAELTQQIDQNPITGQIVQIQTTANTTVDNDLNVQNNLDAGTNANTTNTIGAGDSSTTTIGGSNSTVNVGGGAGTTTNLSVSTGTTTTNIGTGAGNDTLNIGNDGSDTLNVDSQATFTNNVTLTGDDINIGNADTDDIDIIGDVDITAGSLTLADGVPLTIGTSGFTMDGVNNVNNLKQFTITDSGGTVQFGGFLVSTSNAIATP